MIDNTHRPNPDEIARLVKTDELIRYVVEELGGQITAIRKFQNPSVSSTSHLERSYKKCEGSASVRLNPRFAGG